MYIAFLLIAVAIASCVFTQWYMRAVKRYPRFFDIPTARSAHTTPTIRGGGIVCVVLVTGTYIALFPSLLPVILFCAVMAAIGAVDDLKSLSPQLRLMMQICATCALFIWHTPIPFPLIDALGIDNTFFSMLLWLVTVIATVNFFNFMDGINGIALLHTISVSIAAALLFPNAALPMMLIPAALIGGITPNIRGKLFLGDVGSYFLGALFAVLPIGLIAEYNLAQTDLYLWWLLCAVFLIDPVVTLVLRVLRGDTALFSAHAEHAYQRLARRFGHLPVSIGVATVNSVVLFPLAYILRQNDMLLIGLVAVSVLFSVVVVSVARRYA